MIKRQIEQSKPKWKIIVLFSLPLISLIPLLFLSPIPQDPAYHLFADDRSFFGVPNALNVLSNLPFLYVGFLGLQHCYEKSDLSFRYEWAVSFLGISLVAFGSAYYHWNPNNETLVWDRLPMTVGFMGILCAILSEYSYPSVGKILLPPAISIGIISILIWHLYDDLRLYGWVQFMPLLLVFGAIIFFRSQYTHQIYLLYALLFYLASKVTEFLDKEIFHFLGETISGHTIKHLLASIACLMAYLMIKRRKFKTA